MAGSGLTVAYDTGGDVSVYTYNVNTAQWEQIGEKLPSIADQLIGISRDGATVVILVSDFEDDVSFVIAFRFIEGKWQQIGEDIPVDGRRAISADLSQDGNTIAIGNPVSNGSSRFSILGEVKIFRYRNWKWEEVGDTIQGAGSVDCDRFPDWLFFIEPVCKDETGYSVALSTIGDRVAIGSDPMLGYVRVFEDVEGEWRQLGGDIFPNISRQRVSITTDGATIAIGGSEAPVQVFQLQCVDGATPRPTQAPYSPNGVCYFGILCPLVAFVGTAVSNVFVSVFGGSVALAGF